MIGVYSIEIGDKLYIGSSSQIKTRWSHHRGYLERGVHPNLKLQRAYNKYGYCEFIVVELCCVEELLEREQFWLDELECVAEGFNLLPIAGRQVGWNPSEETREKMSLAAIGNQRSLGHKHSLEARKNMSESHKNRAPISEETRLKLSESAKKRRSISDDTRQRMSESAKRRHNKIK